MTPTSLYRRTLTSSVGIVLSAGIALVGAAALSDTQVRNVAQVTPAGTTPAATVPAPTGLQLPWGVFDDTGDEAWSAYAGSTGADKDLLAKIATRPRVRWYGGWVSTDMITQRVSSYVQTSQNGNPDALVQLAVFREWGQYSEQGKHRPITDAEQEEYRAWIRAFAAGVGSARSVVILEPDLPLALKGWKPKVRLSLVRYAAQYLSALPRTSVYIDSGAADWMKPGPAAKLLKRAGVEYTKGFALGATHYTDVNADRAQAARIIAALNKRGLAGKKAVLDTADNGAGFTWGQYYKQHKHGDFDNAETCTAPGQTRCVTLGVPPTPNTGDPNVDAYLWFGRPWLYRQNNPFRMDRALQVAATTPY